MFDRKKTTDTTNTAPAGKKRSKIKWIVLAVVVLVVVFFIWRGIQSAGNASFPVETAAVTRGSIEEIVSVSGTVASAETTDVYATVSVRIGSAPYHVGDRVNKGDVIVAYDAGEMEIARQQAELSLQQADGSYDDSISRESRALSKKYVADRDLPGIQAQIDAAQAQIDALNEEINQKRLRMAQVGTQLQEAMHDINQNGQFDGLNDQSYMETEDEDGNEMYLSLQNAIAENQLAQSNDPQIMSWNKQITDLNEQITKLTEQKSELKADQSAGESSELTAGGRSALEAQRDLTRLTNEKTLEDLKAVEGGLKAEYSGVITETSATEGMIPQSGMKLFTIASTDSIKVSMQISKNDMSKIRLGQAVDITISGRSYSGEVSWISGSAIRNSSNVPVVEAEVMVRDPDENIVLGVEAALKIHTDSAEDVLVLPYEYVNTDTRGDFVYTVEDGVLTRRDVTTGITTSTEAQITEGLSDGEAIVTTDVSELTEGQAVQVMSTAGQE